MMSVRCATKIFLAASLLVAVLSLFPPDYVSANSIPGVVDIFVNNAAYSYVDVYNLSSELIPNVGAAKTVYVNGRVTDADGVGTGFSDGDLDYVELRFYRANVGVSCESDVNNCYKTFCSVTPNSGTVLNYSCMVEVSFLIDSTTAGGEHENETWNAEVIVEDDTDQLASSIKNFEVGTLLSLHIPGSINFGEMARAQSTTSLDNVEMLITQEGNDVGTVTVSGSAMTCSVNGVVALDEIKWSLIDVGADNEVAVSLTGTPFGTGLQVGTDDDVGYSGSLFWNITMPDVVSGICTGNISIEAASY